MIEFLVDFVTWVVGMMLVLCALVGIAYVVVRFSMWLFTGVFA